MNTLDRYHYRKKHRRTVKLLHNSKDTFFRQSISSRFIHSKPVTFVSEILEISILRPYATEVAVILTSFVMLILLSIVWIFGYTILSFQIFCAVYIHSYIIGLIAEYIRLLWRQA